MRQTTVEGKSEQIVNRASVESVDLTQEIDRLSFQSAKDGPILSDSGYVNFAALYLEVARQGPTKVLKMIRR